MKNNPKITCAIFLLIVSFKGFANDAPVILETDWLKTEVGSTGNNLGAKVESIDKHEMSGATIIEISLPINDIDDIDKIEVISKTSEDPIKQIRAPEWIEDYEKGNNGLRLYINKKTGFEFRLRLIDNEKD